MSVSYKLFSLFFWLYHIFFLHLQSRKTKTPAKGGALPLCAENYGETCRPVLNGQKMANQLIYSLKLYTNEQSIIK